MTYISLNYNWDKELYHFLRRGSRYFKVSLYNYNKMLVVKFINNTNALEIFTGNSTVKFF